MTEWSLEQAHRIEKFQRDYFATPPDNITQLAVDAMIIVIALKTSLREVERQTEARVRAETWEAAAQIADGWANSSSCRHHTDDPCCHVTTGAGIAAKLREVAPKERP